MQSQNETTENAARNQSYIDSEKARIDREIEICQLKRSELWAEHNRIMDDHQLMISGNQSNTGNWIEQGVSYMADGMFKRMRDEKLEALRAKMSTNSDKITALKIEKEELDPAVKRANAEKKRKKKIEEAMLIRKKKIDEARTTINELDKDIDKLDAAIIDSMIGEEELKQIEAEIDNSKDGQVHRRLEQKYIYLANDLISMCRRMLIGTYDINIMNISDNDIPRLSSHMQRYADVCKKYEMAASECELIHGILKSARAIKEQKIYSRKKRAARFTKFTKRIALFAIVLSMVYLVYNALSQPVVGTWSYANRWGEMYVVDFWDDGAGVLRYMYGDQVLNAWSFTWYSQILSMGNLTLMDTVENASLFVFGRWLFFLVEGQEVVIMTRNGDDQ